MSKIKGLNDDLYKEYRFIVEKLQVFRDDKVSIEFEKIIDKMTFNYYFQVLFICVTNDLKLGEKQAESNIFFDYDLAFEHYKLILINYINSDAN